MSRVAALYCASLCFADDVGPVDLRLELGEAAVYTAPRSAQLRLLHGILGLYPRIGGALEVLGTDPAGLAPASLRGLRAACAFAPATGAVIANLSIRENVALPLRYHSLCDDSELDERTETALALLELSDVADARPAVLPPERRRRVGLARVFAQRARLNLIQDPYEGLPAGLVDRVHGALVARVEDGASCLLTTAVSDTGTMLLGGAWVLNNAWLQGAFTPMHH